MPPKRAREETSAECPNTALAQAFHDLARYSLKAGDAWPGKAFMKVHDALLKCPTAITSGKEASKLEGVGKASIEKIDEFLSTGKLHKLEDFKATYGELAPMSGGAKSGGGGGGAKAKGGAKKGIGLTVAQKKRIKSAEEEAADLSIDALKSQLRANNQKISGTKGELVERVAQCKVLGAIPTCPECSAGKLRFDTKTGLYTCPGYMDDDTFTPCYYSSADVKRLPWVDVTEK